MSGRYSEHDHEHYERPRRRTRPRTKERPSYDDATDALVVTVDRGRFTLRVEDRVVLAVKARPLGRKGVVVGDRVRVVGDVTGDEGSLARIVEVADEIEFGFEIGRPDERLIGLRVVQSRLDVHWQHGRFEP